MNVSQTGQYTTEQIPNFDILMMLAINQSDFSSNEIFRSIECKGINCTPLKWNEENTFQLNQNVFK